MPSSFPTVPDADEKPTDKVFSSPIRLEIPEVPHGFQADPKMHEQFVLVYNALRRLQEEIDAVRTVVESNAKPKAYKDL